jgi:hypothetical protein
MEVDERGTSACALEDGVDTTGVGCRCSVCVVVTALADGVGSAHGASVRVWVEEVGAVEIAGAVAAAAGVATCCLEVETAADARAGGSAKEVEVGVLSLGRSSSAATACPAEEGAGGFLSAGVCWERRDFAAAWPVVDVEASCEGGVGAAVSPVLAAGAAT